MIDEMDPLLMGTRAFLVNVDNAFDYSEIFLPATGYETNTRVRSLTATIEDELLRIKVTSTYKGCFSTMERTRENAIGKDSILSVIHQTLEKELPNLIIDSVFTLKPSLLPPYTYQIGYMGEQTGRIVAIDDTICTISLADWLSHSTISTELETRNLDYYLSYPYTERYISTYQFPGPVELLNEKSLTSYYDNDFGTYSLKVYQAGANKIAMESVYCIKSAYIPATKYLLLKEINLRQQQAKDAKLLIRKIKE
jgi:hypothetical protein